MRPPHSPSTRTTPRLSSTCRASYAAFAYGRLDRYFARLAKELPKDGSTSEQFSLLQQIRSIAGGDRVRRRQDPRRPFREHAQGERHERPEPFVARADHTRVLSLLREFPQSCRTRCRMRRKPPPTVSRLPCKVCCRHSPPKASRWIPGRARLRRSLASSATGRRRRGCPRFARRCR